MIYPRTDSPALASPSDRALAAAGIGRGPGRQVAFGLALRAARVEACLALGPPLFVREKPPGYASSRERCASCGTLRSQHRVEASA